MKHLGIKKKGWLVGRSLRDYFLNYFRTILWPRRWRYLETRIRRRRSSRRGLAGSQPPPGGQSQCTGRSWVELNVFLSENVFGLRTTCTSPPPPPRSSPPPPPRTDISCVHIIILNQRAFLERIERIKLWRNIPVGSRQRWGGGRSQEYSGKGGGGKEEEVRRGFHHFRFCSRAPQKKTKYTKKRQWSNSRRNEEKSVRRLPSFAGLSQRLSHWELTAGALYWLQQTESGTFRYCTGVVVPYL